MYIANAFCTIHALLLQIASVNGHAAIARVLIEFGANVNQSSSSGQTPLILAAVGGHAELVKVLLEAGADLGAANPHGQTALDIATALEKTVISKHTAFLVTTSSSSVLCRRWWPYWRSTSNRIVPDDVTYKIYSHIPVTMYHYKLACI